MPKITLNPAQQEAVDYSGGPLLVLAGPGTGKTQLLASRVERILTDTDTDASEILCLTFTESGAENMRARLATKIGKEALKIQISTYHAFGTTILNDYQNFSPDYTRRFDAPLDNVSSFKIIKSLRDNLGGLDLLRTASVADLRDTISAVKSARLTPADLLKITEKNRDWSALVASEISPLFDELPKRSNLISAAPVYTAILAKILEHVSDKPLAFHVEPLTNDMARTLESALNSAEAENSVAPLTNWRKTYFEKAADDSWVLKGEIANKKLESLAHLMKDYEETLKKDNLYDYADMITESINVLKSDRAFRLSESERFQHILLDEFQDTNPAEFELVALLADYDQPDIMAVGDDDQAIYEFQGASASNLWDFQKHFNAKVINLNVNYRSYSEIVDTAKKVSAKITDSFSKTAGVEKNLIAHRGPGAVIERHEFLTPEEEYHFLSEKISRLVSSGVAQKDIAVIFPKHRYIAPFLPFLNSDPRLKVSYEKRENILEHPKIAQLLKLADFISDLSESRNASHRLLEILSFPFWQIPPLSAVKITTAAAESRVSALSELLKSDDPKLKSVATFLSDLVAVSFDAPLELFFDYLLGSVPLNGFRSPFLEFYAKNSDTYQTYELYENIAVLKEAVKSYQKSDSPRLKDLIIFIKDYADAGEILLNSSPYKESDDSLNLLTVHRSKGLEFTHVFLLSVDHYAWGKGKGNNNMLSLPKNVAIIRHTGITDDEQLRLLFVALTRARDTLTLTNSVSDYSGRQAARLEYLDELADGSDSSPLIPSKKITLHSAATDPAEKLSLILTSWSSSYTERTPELREFLKNRMKNYRLTATDLVSFIDLKNAGPLEFFRRKVLKAPAEPETESLLYGNLIHQTFEKVTKENLDDSAAIDFYKSAVVELPTDEKTRSLLLEKGAFSLESALASFGPTLRAKNSLAELNFSSEHILVGDVPLTGKIDHVGVDEATKTLEIYDFKTGKIKTGGWDSDLSLFKYKLQLLFYRELLLHSKKFANYKIGAGHIFFVTPDDQGRVSEKVLEFKDEDIALLRRLTTFVYREATTLDFLDDEALAVEPLRDKLPFTKLRDEILPGLS